jgi:DNA recombination protein RmuC
VPSNVDGDTSERIRQLEAELLAVREAKSDFEKRLAVEEQKASIIPELEQKLAESAALSDSLREEKSKAELDFAKTKEALSQTADNLARAEARVAELETQAKELSDRYDRLMVEKSELAKTGAHTQAVLDEKTAALAKLTVEFEATTKALAGANRETGDLQTQMAKLRETLAQEMKNAEEKLTLLKEAKEGMTQEFKVLAADVMKGHGETFSKQNKEQIDAVLAPLKESLTNFQQGLQAAHTETNRERVIMIEQIRSLTEASAKMSVETQNLTRALKGKAQTQGAWGEMILATILEKSGLRDGDEYVTQESHSDEDGARLRPDVVVNLPNNQRIVVDAKVSLTAFEAYVNGETDADRTAWLARHVDSMRRHIKTLSGKEYQQLSASGVDYVIMFVPIEGALAVALLEDPDLTAFAIERNVTIATPTTLMIALRTVRNVWQVERRNRNADAIAQRAGSLYDKFVGFIGDMDLIGTRLNLVQKAHKDAMGKLRDGRGSLFRQTEMLKELGAKTSKSLPSAALDDELENDAEAETFAPEVDEPLALEASRDMDI